MAKGDLVHEDDPSKKGGFSLPDVDFSALLEALLEQRYSFPLTAKGWSMLPSIRDGDVITISSVTDPEIAVGTPVVFRWPRTKMLFVHRILAKSQDRYLMKGDRVFKSDGFIPRKSILGVVTRVERHGKKVAWGLGGERHLLTFLSRTRILYFLFETWKIIPASIRSFLRRRLVFGKVLERILKR